MKRLALWACLLLLPLTAACSHVSGNVEVGYAAGPVDFSATFSIHPDGSISVGGSVGLITEIGVFTVGANIGTNSQPTPDETLLFIRHRVNHGVVDTAYRIGTGEDVTVVIDGLTTINVANHKVTIDASKGKIKEIAIHNAISPTPTQQSQPPSSTLRLVRTIQSSTVSVDTISWSPDSQLIADAGTTGDSLTPTVAEIRRASDGTLVSTHGGFTHYVQDISWSPDGSLIAATDYGCSCTRIWNAASGHTTATLNDYEIDQVSWSPDSKYVVSSGDQPTVWNAVTGAQISQYNGYPARGNPVFWAPHGDLITGGGEVWDAMSGRQVQAFNNLGQGGWNFSSWSPDAHSIISTNSGDFVDWDAATGATKWDVSLPTYSDLLAWSPNGKYIAWADDTLGATAGILSASSGQTVGSFGLSDGNAIDSLAWSPNGRYIATASGGSIQLWAAP